MQQDAEENPDQNKRSQPGTPELLPNKSVTTDYIISVEQVRSRLAEQGLSKSKDTIQRWCRSGDLDCKKQGILNRYFTTEKSLLSLENRLLPDMVADRVGELNPPPLLNAADAKINLETAKVNKPAHTHVPQQKPNSAAAHNDPQRVLQGDAAAHRMTSDRTEIREENAALKAEVKVLREMIGKFEKFADQAVEDKQLTLETFQTMALGGRLERRKPETVNGEVIRATTPANNTQD